MIANVLGVLFAVILTAMGGGIIFKSAISRTLDLAEGLMFIATGVALAALGIGLFVAVVQYPSCTDRAGHVMSCVELEQWRKDGWRY